MIMSAIKLSSLKRFMSLKKGDEIKTENGTWSVVLEPSLAGNVPRVLLQGPQGQLPEFVHYNDKLNSVVDAMGNPIVDLTNAEVNFKIMEVRV